ncbi:2-dehydro-3-deoxy-D-gluconate 5-dehydrogenase [subsurface metagenome]
MPGTEKIKTLKSNIMDSFFLNEKIAIVIGGNKGLGQSMALALAGAGANVCIVGRGPNGFLETAEAIEELGQRGIYFAADITVEEQVKSMVNYVMDIFGHIDILVNSQGANYLQEAAEFNTNQWQKIMDVNIKSVFLCCKHVGKIMIKNKKGKIINISSIRGFQGRSKDLAYAPSKGAVNQLTRSLAINVNAIAPAFTVTAISEPFLKDKKNHAWVISRIPMKRLGKLEDVSGSVIFLASEASNFINGHILVVDGGWLAA